jgi:hypothetical protein
VAGRYGKGRVVYVTPNLTGHYLYENNWEIRRLAMGLLGWASEPAVRLRAPASVELTLLAQPQRRRWVAHLLNLAPPHQPLDNAGGYGGYGDGRGVSQPHVPRQSARHAARPDGLAGEQAEAALRNRLPFLRVRPVAPIDETLSALDLELRVRLDRFPAAGAEAMPGQPPVRAERRDGWLVVSIPRLDLHTAVILNQAP